MKHIVNTSWSEDMAFHSFIDHHSIILDAQVENGGRDAGPSPKKLLLSALAGCTGMDVVAILQKMRVSLTGLNIILHFISFMSFQEMTLKLQNWKKL